MKPRRIHFSSTLVTVAIVIIAISLSVYKFQIFSIFEESYWLWAGITAKDAPPNAELYIYQGLILTRDGKSTYERIGLYPHPVQAKKLVLVYRLEGDLPAPQFVVDVFKQSIKGWKRHGLVITGVQIDFDSATSKLLLYSDFLKKLREKLPPDYELSVTGLSDWAVNGNQEVMSRIVNVTDEVVFQLYQDRHPLDNADFYIDSLANYKAPFRVGFLVNQDNSRYIDVLKQNPNFRGVIYFIQK